MRCPSQTVWERSHIKDHDTPIWLILRSTPGGSYETEDFHFWHSQKNTTLRNLSQQLCFWAFPHPHQSPPSWPDCTNCRKRVLQLHIPRNSLLRFIIFLSWAVKVMADDHLFYSTEMAMLCVRGANVVDWVGTPDDFDFDVFLTPFGNFCSWGEVKVLHVVEELLSKGGAVFFLLVIGWWLMRWWCLISGGNQVDQANLTGVAYQTYVRCAGSPL